MAPPHPLRRISTGSLSSLARSQDRVPHASPSGLDFLQPALTDLADEAATLSSNVQKLNELHDALGTFNEAFAGWMYALKMNAFCVEWKHAPTELSFQRLPALLAAARPPSPPLSPPSRPSVSASTSHSYPARQSAAAAPAVHLADLTYATAYSSSIDDVPATIKPAKKPLARKPAVNNALRKKRELEVAAIIDTLPLEYRGRDLSARLGMEKVINKLMDQPEGLTIDDVVSSPELPRTKVNKHLIALVTKKVVLKGTVGVSPPLAFESQLMIKGKAVYRWVGI